MKTKAQRHNERQDAIWERAKALSKGESAHTPGPWTEDPEGIAAVSIEGADGTIICDVHGASNDPICEANAKLIAAAPETAAERDRLASALESERAAYKMSREVNAKVKAQRDELLAACKALLLASEKLVAYDDYVKQFGFSQEHAVDNALTAIQHAQETQQ